MGLFRAREDLHLYAGVSQAFRAPNLITVNESIVSRNNTNTDWVCQYIKDTTGWEDGLDGNCSYSMQRRASGSDNLKPEKSDNTSIGVVLTPISNVTFTIDFWEIDVENQQIDNGFLEPVQGQQPHIDGGDREKLGYATSLHEGQNTVQVEAGHELQAPTAENGGIHDVHLPKDVVERQKAKRLVVIG